MAARLIDGVWYVDFRFEHACRRVERVRKRSPVQSKRGAEEYERQLRIAMLNPTQRRADPPTFATFAEEFMRTYARSNNKPSEQQAKRCILDHHLLPAFGPKRLDAIGTKDVEQLKAALLDSKKSAKRVNNVLGCLGKLLRYAVDVEVIAAMPCKIKMVKVPPQPYDFLDFEEYDRLVAAIGDDKQRLAMMLLGTDAGLRRGELLALEWSDVDLKTRTVTVRRNVWEKTVAETYVGSPKGGRERKVPMTDRLHAALQSHRHLRGRRVLCYDDGSPLTTAAIEAALRYACRRAGLREIGCHVLRHTYCSHLAMRGAAPKAIQELAGHSDLKQTLRYMHQAPGALRDAVALLDRGQHMGNAASANAEVRENTN